LGRLLWQVLYNATRVTPCYELPVYPTASDPRQPMDGLWDWQWCTEQLPDSYWFSTYGGSRDMFWPNPYNQSLVNEHCRLAWGVTPRAAAVASFLAAVLTKIYLCDVCSCRRNIETQRPRPGTVGGASPGDQAWVPTEYGGRQLLQGASLSLN
jgi:hypothetical protein